MEEIKYATQLLKDAGIAITHQRIVLLEAILASGCRTNRRRISAAYAKTLNRGTISRILQVFVKKKLLFIIPSSDYNIWYALNKNTITSDGSRKLQFICKRCGDVIYIENIPMPPIDLPEGFTSYKTDTLIKGICCNCNQY
jgi:Fur family ferric uptake transcriptional regulator